MSQTNCQFIFLKNLLILFMLFQRGGQRISRVAMVLLSGGWLFAIISLFVAVGHKITWLQYLYYLSYIKLGVTLIKYVPQVSITVVWGECAFKANYPSSSESRPTSIVKRHKHV